MAPENRHAHPNYASGEDYILEFRSFRYGFNSVDFAQRVEMAAMELGLVEPGILRQDECADLVQLVAGGSIEFPVSSLGEYLLQRGERSSPCTARAWCTGCANWCSAAPGWI